MKSAILSLILIAFAATLCADSWMAPTERIFKSTNGKYLLHVTPKAMKSFPELPEDAAQNAEEREKLGLNEACYATLFSKDEEKWIGSAAEGFRPMWRKKLINEFAPMDAYISDDGEYVVTTNDYGTLGYGDNVVVIYNAEGTLIRRYKLFDFIPAAQIEHMPQSVSSIHWSGQHRIDTESGLLLLKVWQSGNVYEKQPVKYRTVRIRLSSGEILKDSKSK